MSDQEVIDQGVAAAKAEGRVIDDLTARVIAAGWHSGQASDLYSFQSSGAISDTVHHKVRNEHRFAEDYKQVEELNALETYLLHHGERGPQAGWDELSW